MNNLFFPSYTTKEVLSFKFHFPRRFINDFFLDRIIKIENNLKNIISDISKIYFEKYEVKDVFLNEHLLKLTSYQKIENFF